MALVYRSVPDDDAHQSVYRRLLRYAFAPERGPDWSDDPPERPDEFAPRGLYEASADVETGAWTADGGPPPADDVDPDSLVVAGALLWFDARIREEWRSVGGITAVASPPERRRRGHVGTLLRRMHTELRGRDVRFAVLWPFSHPFYRTFGYERTNDYVVHEVAPAELDTPAATPSEEGSVRRLTDDDVDALRELHGEAAPEPLALRRSDDWWRLRIFRSWTDDRFVYGWADEDGTLRSYLAYRVESDDDEGRRLAVDYWGAADDEAYRQLLRFLRNHDSQVTTVRLLASDASLLDRLADPGEAETTVKPGPMARVVDARAALSGVATPAAATGRVVLRVRDSRHDWNDERLELGVEGGRTNCRAVSGGTAAEQADTAVAGGGESTAEVDVGALAQLVVGARSAATLAGLGRLDAGDDAVARLDALFPVESPGPYLREWF